MKQYNNVRKIREIYGATQEEIAKVAGVNRSTVSLWESGARNAPKTKLEKLSIFYGIGPEYFYDEPIDETIKDMLIQSSLREKEITAASNEKRNKAEELASYMENTSFNQAIVNFMYAMKVLLATADSGKLDDLRTAYKIDQKMARRLEAIIKIREEEEENKTEKNEDTLFDLIESLEK